MDQVRDELMHYGVLGMKWGKRKAPTTLSTSGKTSSTTKKVIDDYNKMDDKEFKGKYQTSKKTYAKRVEKYGDPYMNSPLAKIGKKAAEGKTVVDGMKTRMNEKRSTSIQKDIDSFKPFAKTGIKTKSGKMLITSEEIQQSMAALEKQKSRISKYGDKYTVTPNKDGSVTLTDGIDVFKVR